MKQYDFLIIGGGIIGNAIARELSQRTRKSIAVLEKEDTVAKHASGRNSGVVHAGFYYPSTSLKAKFCAEGNRLLKAYCAEKKIPVNACGKVIVTQNDADVKRLEELKKRGDANNVKVRIIDKSELKKIEPYAITHEVAMHSPSTAVVDSALVTKHVYKDAEKNGVKYFFNTQMQGLDADRSKVITNKGDFKFNHLINCAGLHADTIAHLFGLGKTYTILPFRGDYYALRKDRTYLVNSNIYPVPDPRNPFLGVHFTRTIYGDVIVGPTATPVIGRENYKGVKGGKLSEATDIFSLQAKLFFSDAVFRDILKDELSRKGRYAYARASAKLVEGVTRSDLIPNGKTGIRAQLFDLVNKKLVSDFVVEKSDNSTHVLNAVSPAFTSSLPFSKYIVDEYLL